MVIRNCLESFQLLSTVDILEELSDFQALVIMKMMSPLSLPTAISASPIAASSDALFFILCLVAVGIFATRATGASADVGRLMGRFC